MFKKNKKTTSNNPPTLHESVVSDRIKIATLVIFGAVILFLMLSLFSYSHTDPGWTVSSSHLEVDNYAGVIGAYTANLILSIFGIFGFAIPFILLYTLWIILLERKNFAQTSIILMLIKLMGLIMIVFAGSGMADLGFSAFAYYMPQGAGGILGYEVAKYTVLYLSMVGGFFILAVIFLLGVTLYSGSVWFHALMNLFKWIGISFKRAFDNLKERRHARKAYTQAEKIKTTDKETSKLNYVGPTLDIEKNHPTLEKDNLDIEMPETEMLTDNIMIEPQTELPLETPISIKEETIEAPKKSTKKPKVEKETTSTDALDGFDPITNLPKLDLLDPPELKKVTVSKEYLDHMSALVEQKLADFGVKAKVVGAHPGPVITRYELELAAGVKVSKLSGLGQDLARELATSRVRVVEVIPGKTCVGLELPNEQRAMVKIKEVLSDSSFARESDALTMGLGVDISGNPFCANLGKMPHLLVAGTTGSGKSVGVNAMIISMLYKAGPEDLRFIMIDPKQLELSIYGDIPHQLTPVVTDMNDAANALRWCVREMERRYKLMAMTGVRNIASLNEKIKQANAKGEPMLDPVWMELNPNRPHDAPHLEKMPYIVVIADEFADMIMTVGKKVEELIARLAQKARAAGIHLILATQRPSVDVVTGLIKANIPTRMSFQVSSKIDSRTILDQQGAEQLLGHGDMLYLKPGVGAPVRVHGAFVSDDEVHRVVDAWKAHGAPEFIETITSTDDEGANPDGSDSGGEKDALYDEAVQIVLETQKASISGVQRRLRIGYNRAARLIEDMEAAGIVSPMQSNGMREILVQKN